MLKILDLWDALENWVIAADTGISANDPEKLSFK
ncbi:hypothetical protein SAMN05518672_112127 [Chitinophaga sp. CF118]|nr:hypothetical protein SAMN05518672_112127 [Chitinophaga sp. CF118]